MVLLSSSYLVLELGVPILQQQPHQLFHSQWKAVHPTLVYIRPVWRSLPFFRSLEHWGRRTRWQVRNWKLNFRPLFFGYSVNHQITPTAQGGKAGSVSLLLTKNPCSLNCPSAGIRGVSFEWTPRSRQTFGPISGSFSECWQLLDARVEHNAPSTRENTGFRNMMMLRNQLYSTVF